MKSGLALNSGFLCGGLRCGAVALVVAAPVRAGEDISFEERRLTTIPEDATVGRADLKFAHLQDIERWGWSFASPDGKSVFYMASKRVDEMDKGFVFAGGKAEALYDAVRYLLVSKGGQRYGYAAKVGRQWFAVIDGEPSEAYKNVMGVCFSPDGKRCGYRARTDDDGWAVIIDGETPSVHPGVGPVSFSPDSKRFAYPWNTGLSMWRVAIDGVSGAEFDAIRGPAIFSADSKQFTYVGINVGRHFAEDAEGKRHLVVADQVSDPYDDVYPVVHLDKSRSAPAVVRRSGGG